MNSSVTNQPCNLDLHQILFNTRDVYARLLQAMERALAVDVEADPDMAEVRNQQVDKLMAEADEHLESLRRKVHPWSQRRKQIPSAQAEQVDLFFEFLEKSLLGIQNQITHRVGSLEEQKNALQQAMQALNQQRNAHKGYMSPATPSRYIEKKA